MTIVITPVKRSPELTRTLKQVHRIIERDGMHCHWCGRLCKWGNPNADLFPTREHLVRRCDGGSSAMSNLVLACRKCNNTRHSPHFNPKVATPLDEALLLAQELPALSSADR